MARVSRTEMAVLGVLSVRGMSGYAVREAIRDVLGHFWSESFGQIYPALAQLREDGLVEQQEGDRPGSSIYVLTKAGRARLTSLLREPDSPAPPRNGLMLRLFFGRVIGPLACRELVEQAQATARQQLATYQAIRAELANEEQDAQHHPYWLLTISAGEHSARAALSWAEESLAALDAIAAAESPPRSGRRGRTT